VTLVELLVVISIIGLMMATFIPVMGKARDHSESLVCLSSLRSIALATQLYAAAHSDRLLSSECAMEEMQEEAEIIPVESFAPKPKKKTRHGEWLEDLQDFSGSDLTIRCINDESPHWDAPVSKVDLEDGCSTDGYRRVSYGLNRYTTTAVANIKPGPDGRVQYRGPYNKLDAFRRPATTIHVVELAETGPAATSDHIHPEQWDIVESRQAAALEIALDRHLGKSNYAFIDGHAESLVPFENTYQLNLPASKESLEKGGGLIWIHNQYDPAVGR
jgi:prepilin-type processing-associated H-X9-DG protein